MNEARYHGYEAKRPWSNKKNGKNIMKKKKKKIKKKGWGRRKKDSGEE